MDETVKEELKDFLKGAKDDFGLPLYRSTAEAVTEAVKQFLRKYRESIITPPKKEEAVEAVAK